MKQRVYNSVLGTYRFPFSPNECKQREHVNGFSPRWTVRTCLFLSELCANAKPQIPHTCCLSPTCSLFDVWSSCSIWGALFSSLPESSTGNCSDASFEKLEKDSGHGLSKNLMSCFDEELLRDDILRRARLSAI